MSRFNIQDSIIRTTISIVAFYGLFNLFAGSVFACQRIDCQPRADKVRAELAELKGQGINTYIYWQYSGNNCSPWTDSNDQYSFFQGDPLCGVLKEAADSGMTIGVNAHHLSTHIGEVEQLNYLKNDCGVSIIRFWAYPNIGSGAATAANTVRAITAAGMQAIPVICDYSNTCTELGITGSTQANPTSWYESGYKGAYKNYALQLKGALSGVGSIYGIELLNEPHCGGQAGCVTPYSNWARDMVGVLSGFRVGIGQKASENTTRGDSPGVGTPSDFTVSNQSVGTASAHFYNEGEKTLALQAASQAASLGKTFYIGERGYTCSGEEVGSPHEQAPPPGCTPNEYSLTVKGTIKSSYDFAVIDDAMTSERNLVWVYDLDESQRNSYPITNNQPVNGAIVAIYPSYAFEGGDPFGQTVEYSTGKVGGMLRTNSGVNKVRVGPDGTFKITTTNTCDEVWNYGGWEQYLAVICPEKQADGTVKAVVSDLYAFALNKAGAEVDFSDINVPCRADLARNAVAVPQSLSYVARDPNKFLACSNAGEFPGQNEPKKVKVDKPLEFNDEFSQPNRDPGIFNIIEMLINWIKQWIHDHRAFHGVREGFDGVQGVSGDLNSIFTSPVGFFGGIQTDFSELAKYFPEGNPDTYPESGNHEQKLPLPLCSALKDCNQSVNFTSGRNNSQSCGGAMNNLRAPVDISTIDQDGNVVADEFGYAARYRNTSKDIEACKESESPSAARHLLKEFAPPEYICGDTNLDGTVSAGVEMPCPDNSSCGDLDDSGTIDGSETACSGGGVTYQFDSRYFPYDVLFTGTTEPQGNEFTVRLNDYNDSVSVAYAPGRTDVGRRIIPFGGGGGTQPDNVSTGVGDGMRFPAGFFATVNPPGDNSDAKVSEVTGSDLSVRNPASLLLGSPTNFLGYVTINTIREALATLRSAIKFEAEMDFYKIGSLKSMCTCSLIENQSATVNGTKVENCIHQSKAVQVAKPLREYNELTDAVPAGRGGSYGFAYNNVGEITDKATALQPGYKFMGELRETGSFNGDDLYYEQAMADNAIGAFFDTLREIVACSAGGWIDENDVTVGRDVGCSRTIPQILKSQLYVPWFKAMDKINNSLITVMALAEPEVVKDKVMVRSVYEVDSAATKSQDPEAHYGAGSEIAFDGNASAYVTLASNAVSSPTFGSGGGGSSFGSDPEPVQNPGGSEDASNDSCGAACTGTCYKLEVRWDGGDRCKGAFVSNNLPGPGSWGDVSIEFKNITTGYPVPGYLTPHNMPPGVTWYISGPGQGHGTDKFKFDVNDNQGSDCQATGGIHVPEFTCP